MSEPEPTSPDEEELGRFIADLASIAGVSASRISAESRLTADLGFDAHAFNVLAVLLFERYECAYPRPFSLGDEGALTVGAVFEDYVLARRGR